MVYFFFGHDTFSLLGEVSKIKTKFLSEHPQGGMEDVVVSGGSNEKELLTRLSENLMQPGLFESASLVIVQDLSRHIKKYPKVEEYVLEILSDGLSEDKTLIIAETVMPDRRLKFFKRLKKSAEVKEFPIPEGEELMIWIKDKLKSEGFEIAPEAVERMLELLGSNADEEMYDLWQVKSELEKLMLYKWDEKQIDIDDVELLVSPNITENVFALTNLFADGKLTESIKLMDQMIGRVPDVDLKSRSVMIVGALAGQIRSLLLVKSVRAFPPDEISKKLGWKPGRVWINQKLAGKFREQKLRQMIRDLRQIDLRLKTSEEPPRLLLQLFIQKAKV